AADGKGASDTHFESFHSAFPPPQSSLNRTSEAQQSPISKPLRTSLTQGVRPKPVNTPHFKYSASPSHRAAYTSLRLADYPVRLRTMIMIGRKRVPAGGRMIDEKNYAAFLPV